MRMLVLCGLALATVVVAGCGSSEKSSAKTAAATTTAASQEFVTFGDGTYTVGSTVKARTYRAPDPTVCSWARLRGFGGDLNEIIANDISSGPTVVTILPSDAGFQTSGCGTWTSDLSAVTQSKTSFPAGTYIVNTDIAPGTYSAPGGSGCSWARLSGFGGTLEEIIANDIASGNVVVTIAPTDKGFQSSRCGTFTQTSSAAAPPASKAPVGAKPKPGFSDCGGGVEALTATTSCGFAQNVFYEFYEASGERAFPVYSPATKARYSMSCSVASVVTCTGGNGAEVRFPMSAVQAYTEQDAERYAATHDLGH